MEEQPTYRLTFKDLPEQCKQCKRLLDCLWFTTGAFYYDIIYFDRPIHCPSRKDWEVRMQKCKRNNWFKWEDRLTKYDFEEAEKEKVISPDWHSAVKN